MTTRLMNPDPGLWRMGGVSLALGLSGLLLTAGCREKPAPTNAATAVQQQIRKEDDLALAVDSLRKLAEGAESQTAQRTIFYLNQWLSADESVKSDWKPDRLVDTLPRALRNTPGLESLDSREFTVGDLAYLQQNLWLRDIAERIRQQPSPDELKPWLSEIEKSVGLPESEQLAAAEQLFDWTIRNIQLDELPPTPKAPVATAGTTDPVAPAAQGEVGPGYSHLPLQTLLYGHGDALERSRVFVLLCRQVGVDAVVLGVIEESSPTPRAWLPAAFVGKELYLFDTQLGLPIPGPDNEGIATLAQVSSDPALLRKLDLEGGPAYPIGERDLMAVVALIEAEPAALSQRMQLLQAALPSNNRLALAVYPSQLEPKLRQAKPIAGVNLWRVPYEAILYQIGRMSKIGNDPAAIQQFQEREMVFSPQRPLMRARNLHLQGRFESQEQEKAARALYLESRPPDRQITGFQSSEFIRKAMGVEQSLPADPEQRKAALASMANIAHTGKHHATYWMALTYYESGKYETAIEWLAERTLKAYPPSPWIPGARYNLARSYEALGQHETARKWLESDADSPQRHGNLLRARWLAARSAEGTAAEASSTDGDE